MREYGGERVIRSLLSYSCRLSARAIVSTLPTKIKVNHENDVFMVYITECARMISENASKFVGGSYMLAKFNDVIHPQPVDNRTGEEIVADVIDKIGLEVCLN